MAMISCYVRYVIDPNKLEEFEYYAPTVDFSGGEVRRYSSRLFRSNRVVPTEGPASTEFSFPNIGGPGPGNVAKALFSFTSVAEYEQYRKKAAADAECQEATNYQKKTNCFLKYQRSFMRRISQ
jgi:hypothetical protein